MRSISTRPYLVYEPVPSSAIGIEEGWGVGTEAVAKVVASIAVAKFVQFLAALGVLPRSLWNKWLNSPLSFRSTDAKQLARQEIEQNFAPSNRRDDLCICFSLHPSSIAIDHSSHAVY